MRDTLPATTPLRVSTSATWPIAMSFVCVSAIRSSALRTVGSATRAMLRAGLHLRANFDRQHLQHAGHAGLDLQIVQLPQAQLVGGPALIDVGFLRCQLRLRCRPCVISRRWRATDN